mmetsp:Transcript_55277/g.157082  ORF Transcript_55277/g.157082 Transcript_55277/m.157082 type:complete len:98 (+) Transcript_55277:766-1059(+)
MLYCHQVQQCHVTVHIWAMQPLSMTEQVAATCHASAPKFLSVKVDLLLVPLGEADCASPLLLMGGPQGHIMLFEGGVEVVKDVVSTQFCRVRSVRLV